MTSGEKKAWEILSGLDHIDVCKNADVYYENKNYVLTSLGIDFLISPETKEMRAKTPAGESILKKLGYFFNHSALYYLINAKDILPTKKLIKPVGLKGGEVFFRGTHVLPLDKLAEKYNNDKTGFIEKGKSFNGTFLSYGDASIELLPMPRIPVTLILWLADDEFPARAELLFDSTCERHLPIDIIWSIAMMTVLVMI